VRIYTENKFTNLRGVLVILTGKDGINLLQLTYIQLVGLLFITACTSDLAINHGHPAVPVIWCAMNPYNSMQYVRIQKTFSINHKGDCELQNPVSI